MRTARFKSLLCVLCVLCGALPGFAAQTLKQRGFATQSYGVQNAGAPGDAGAIDLGPGFTRRPFGPSLSGWAMGWSAHNSAASDRHFWTMGGGSGPDTKGLLGAWYFFGPGVGSGGNQNFTISLLSSGGDFQSILLNVSTMSLDLSSSSATFAASTNIKTVPRHQWVWLALAWEQTAANTWTLAVLYKEPGQAMSTLATKTAFTMAGFYSGAYVCTQSKDAGATIAARIGLPSLYQIASIAADATYPTEIIEPAATPNAWYVSSAATGAGDGTSLPQAWTTTQLLAETGASNFTVLSGSIVDPRNANAIVDTTAIDGDVLKGRYVAGTALANGDAIYFNDAAGPIRLGGGLSFNQSSACRLLPDPALKRRVEIRGTTRLSPASFALISGANYSYSIACNHPVVFEFDSQAEADSATGKPRWLAHPSGITTGAGFAGVSTDGSFASDGGGGAGTAIFLRPTGSGNPAANGKVYEVTTASNADLITFAGSGGLMKDLIVRFVAGVETNNNFTVQLGRMAAMGGDGMVVIDNCDLRGAGSHAAIIYETGLSLKQRNIIINCTINDCRPTAYDGGLNSTLIVQDNTTNGRDNQWYWENNSCATNVGVVGSTAGTIDVNSATVFEHTSGGAHPFSKGWFINNRMPGGCVLGNVTSTPTIRSNALGFAGTTPIFGGTALSLTRNSIVGAGLPTLGEAGGTANVRNNIFVATGAIGTEPSVLGTINFQGNTIDALAASGGTSKALWTRGGVVALNFSGNAVLFNNGDLYRLLDTITPGSGDSLSMIQNQLQGSDANRILVTAYAGANTKTLAQLVAGGQDSGSAWTAALVLDANYKPRFDSAARNFVNLATVTGLQNTSDWRGRLRGSSGASEAGGVLYSPPVDDSRLSADVGIGN